MTVVITPVGTSLFTNGAIKDKTISDLFEDIEDQPGSEWDSYPTEISMLKEGSKDFIATHAENAAAEFQSSFTIRGQIGHDIVVRLLASDTIASRLAAEILQSNAPSVLGPQCSFEFDPDIDLIKGLQVMYPMEFQNNGIPNLTKRLEAIHRSVSEGNHNLAVNITPGYAAIVVLLTNFSQSIGGVPLYYHFKDSHMAINFS